MRVRVGYGEYKGYRLAELPDDSLQELAKRYPLLGEGEDGADYEDLVITVAVHAEVERRANGGQLERRTSTLRELAEEIIAKGYQQASKSHHPDGNGHHDAQVLLSRARDELRRAASEIEEDPEEDGTTIPEPSTSQSEGGWSFDNDDDVPF